jgi:site-specific recombinase XerC
VQKGRADDRTEAHSARQVCATASGVPRVQGHDQQRGQEMIERENYQAVRDYLKYESEVLQHDPMTVTRTRSRLYHLLRWADETKFTSAPKIRPVFPRYMATTGMSATGVKRLCQYARTFFLWLRTNEPRKYADITPAWIATLRPSKMGDEPRKPHQAVTLDQVRALLAIKSNDLGIRRDQAAAAFLFLSGMRATAFGTLPIKCVDIAARKVHQLPTMGVVTKNRKAAVTTLLDIPDLLAVVAEWDAFVRSKLSEDGLWYPVIEGFGTGVLIERQAGQFRHQLINRRMKDLFKLAGLAPLSAHKFRHGHALYGLGLSKDMNDFKAVSLNLMHSTIGITDGIYAVLSDENIQAQIAGLGKGKADDRAGTPSTDEMAAIIEAVIKRMGKAD